MTHGTSNCFENLHRIVAATVRMIFPWVRLLEQKAETLPGAGPTDLEALKQRRSAAWFVPGDPLPDDPTAPRHWPDGLSWEEESEIAAGRTVWSNEPAYLRPAKNQQVWEEVVDSEQPCDGWCAEDLECEWPFDPFCARIHVRVCRHCGTTGSLLESRNICWPCNNEARREEAINNRADERGQRY